MAYAQNSNIEAIDYNNLAWGSNAGGTYVTSSANKNLAVIWGVGNGRYGWGQNISSIPAASLTATTGALTQVAATNTVTATQWNGLILAVNKGLYHTNSANLALTGVSVGSNVTYYSTISSGITTAWNAADIGSVLFTIDNSTPAVSTRSSTWQSSCVFSFTLSFEDADKMRYWFNQGNKIKITSAGPSGSGRNADWRTLCTAMGTIVYGYNTTTKSGGSGSPTVLRSTAGTGGLWGTSTSGVERIDFEQYSTGSAYTQNYIKVTSTISGSAGSNGGKGTSIVFKIYLVDDDTNVFQQTVASGASATFIESTHATGALDPSVWGTVTIATNAIVAS